MSLARVVNPVGNIELTGDWCPICSSKYALVGHQGNPNNNGRSTDVRGRPWEIRESRKLIKHGANNPRMFESNVKLVSVRLVFVRLIPSRVLYFFQLLCAVSGVLIRLMARVKARSLVIGLGCSLFASMAQAWDHSNYARFTQYNRPYFLAQLQINATSESPASVLTGDYPFRLDLAIEADFLSDRRLSRLWRESMGLNANGEQFSKETIALTQLYAFINTDLYKGDHFLVVYTPGRGTSLQINSQPSKFIDNSMLGVLMLQGLLGEVPLSSEFKSGLLTTDASDPVLARDFLALQPSAARAQQLLAATAVDDKPSDSSQSAVEDAAVPAAAVEQEPSLSQPATPPTTAPATRPKPTVKLSPPSRVSAANRARVAQAHKPVTTEPPLATQPARSEPAEPIPAPVDSESVIVAKKAYQAQLERAIKKYQTIPFKAFSRRMEGDVLLRISVDDKGYLTRLDLAKPSRHNVLNDQALDAVASAEPFAPIPADLGVKEFSFELTLSYDLVY